MCGRFILIAPGRIVAEHFSLDREPDLEPRYNIAPSQDVAVVRKSPESDAREPVLLRWGLIPFWAEDTNIGYKMINARAETAAKKPAFKTAFKRRRCLIPTDGFYEWKKEGKQKTPYLCRMKDERLFAFAGIWEHWEGSEDEVVESCSILTTDANDLIALVHDRMPVILPEESYDDWLSIDSDDSTDLQSLLKPFPSDQMKAYPVGTEVNKPSQDRPELIEAKGPELGEE